MEIYKNNKPYCPICNKHFESSETKNVLINDRHTRWFADMINHFRDVHIPLLGKYIGPYSPNYIGYWFKDCNEVEGIVMEKAKRHMLRKTKEFLNKEGFTLNHLALLGNNSNDTMQVASEILEKRTGNSEQ